MATPVIMPKQGQSVESCIIAKWHKKKGDKVAVGDLLFSYETDKASFDEEAKVGGILLDVFFAEGDDVPCLTNVCVIGDAGENAAAFNPNAPAAAAPAAPAAPDQASQGNVVTAGSEPQPGVTAPAPAAEAASLKISPRARNLAEQSGVDIRYAAPSGPYGRIIEKDIVALQEAGMVFTPAAIAAQMQGEAGPAVSGTGLGGRITTADLTAPSAPAVGAAAAAVAVPAVAAPAAAAPEVLPTYQEVKLSNIRKVIAKAMYSSISSTAQLTLNASFDASDILEFRKKLKTDRERLGLENITINDMIVYAVSRTLLNHKDLNAHFLDDRMKYFDHANVAVAVDTERGLMVPVVFRADRKSLDEIARETKRLAKECQAGTVNPDYLKNGSFTISNLGTLDIESFTPILNPPQTGILGVNTIVRRAREVDGAIGFYPAIGLSLTFDHRALDGAPAAKFLKELKTNLENFSVLLAR